MLTINQLKAQATAVTAKFSDVVAIGVHSEIRWGEPAQTELNGRPMLVTQCDSPLAIRLALRDGTPGSLRMIVTPLTDNDLSDDILLRFKPRRLITLDDWQIVKSMFQAKSIDPRLSRLKWLPEVLMRLPSGTQIPAAPGGFLDAETIWPIVLKHQIGLADRRPDLMSILEWSLGVANIAAFRSAPADVQAAMVGWLETQAGPVVSFIMDCVRKLQKPDCLPLGLAMGVFLDQQHSSSLALARGKLEGGFLNNKTLSLEALKAWNAAATEIATLRLTDGRTKQFVLDRADEILQEIGAVDHAWLSSTSKIGYTQRLKNFGQRLIEMVDSNFQCSVDVLKECRNLVSEHQSAKNERRRLQRLDMAIRLAKWASKEPEKQQASTFSQAAAQHISDDGFVDWARQSLINAEPVHELSQAYTKLYRYCTKVRQEHSRRFAELLADFTKADSKDDSIVPVEKVLERIVAPIAAKNKVLVIVMDGMSVAVFRELMLDLHDRDWILASPKNCGLMTGLAVVPSQTEVSRASLLSGKLVNCHSDKEKKNFAEHAALNEVSRNGYPPVLFHKQELHKPDDEDLHSEVRKEIGNSHRKVVGVVVNAVDDHLLKGDQLEVQWYSEGIRGLATLLHEARNNDRVIVMVSDHGHVLDFESVQPSKKDEKSGERWRLDDGNPQYGELQIQGYRVTPPGNPNLKNIIVPWVEQIRYGIKKNGYHGGASPQEMIIPIAVLTSNDKFPEGWSECPIDTPDWWDVESVAAAELEIPSIRLKPIQPPEPPPGMLFPLEPLDEPEITATDEQGTEPNTDSKPAKIAWIEALLACPIYESQKAFAGRAVPTDQSMRRLLESLHSAGGKLTGTALSKSLNLSPMRLRSTLAISQRILNVEGFGVLVRDEASNTVELNIGLLLSQFDLVGSE